MLRIPVFQREVLLQDQVCPYTGGTERLGAAAESQHTRENCAVSCRHFHFTQTPSFSPYSCPFYTFYPFLHIFSVKSDNVTTV